MKPAFEKAVAIISFTAALSPLLLWYFRRLKDGGDEPLGLVALALAALLAWKERNEFSASPRLSILLLAIYGGTIWLNLPPLIRAIPALAALAAWYGLWKRPPLLALLFLSLPVITSLQFYANYPLRVFAAHAAEIILGLFGISVTLSGVNLNYEGISISVDPPCSGIRMLWVSCFLAASFAGRARLGWIATALLGGSAVILAIIANALRATILFFPESGLVHWPHWTHQATGIVLFAATSTILLLSSNSLQR